MNRKYVDCREQPSESKCTITILDDDEDELIEAVVQHACTVHGHTDSPEFRQQIRQAIKTGAPAA